MSKEAIIERMAVLQKQKEKALATLTAVDGAMQECEYWLQQLVLQEQSSNKDSDLPVS